MEERASPQEHSQPLIATHTHTHTAETHSHTHTGRVWRVVELYVGVRVHICSIAHTDRERLHVHREGVMSILLSFGVRVILRCTSKRPLVHEYVYPWQYRTHTQPAETHRHTQQCVQGRRAERCVRVYRNKKQQASIVGENRGQRFDGDFPG